MVRKQHLHYSLTHLSLLGTLHPLYKLSRIANVHDFPYINTLLQIIYARIKINVNVNIIYTYMFGT